MHITFENKLEKKNLFLVNSRRRKTDRTQGQSVQRQIGKLLF